MKENTENQVRKKSHQGTYSDEKPPRPVLSHSQEDTDEKEGCHDEPEAVQDKAVDKQGNENKGDPMGVRLSGLADSPAPDDQHKGKPKNPQACKKGEEPRAGLLEGSKLDPERFPEHQQGQSEKEQTASQFAHGCDLDLLLLFLHADFSCNFFNGAHLSRQELTEFSGAQVLMDNAQGIAPLDDCGTLKDLCHHGGSVFFLLLE